MDVNEARALAKALNLPSPKTWGDFFGALAERDLDLGVDEATGDWVVFTKSNEVLARAA